MEASNDKKQNDFERIEGLSESLNCALEEIRAAIDLAAVHAADIAAKTSAAAVQPGVAYEKARAHRLIAATVPHLQKISADLQALMIVTAAASKTD